jgi:hypothetical protein
VGGGVRELRVQVGRGYGSISLSAMEPSCCCSAVLHSLGLKLTVSAA